MTSNKETYTGKQCVDNEEAEKIFTFLEDQMNNFSAQFSGMCRKVIYSIFASSWATIFASKDKDIRFFTIYNDRAMHSVFDNRN